MKHDDNFGPIPAFCILGDGESVGAGRLAARFKKEEVRRDEPRSGKVGWRPVVSMSLARCRA